MKNQFTVLKMYLLSYLIAFPTGHQLKRMNAYDAYDEQLNKLKLIKDLNSFNSAIKTVSNDLKNETQAIGDHQTKFKTDGPEIADKLAELQKLDKVLIF